MVRLKQKQNQNRTTNNQEKPRPQWTSKRTWRTSPPFNNASVRPRKWEPSFSRPLRCKTKTSWKRPVAHWALAQPRRNLPRHAGPYNGTTTRGPTTALHSASKLTCASLSLTPPYCCSRTTRRQRNCSYWNTWSTLAAAPPQRTLKTPSVATRPSPWPESAQTTRSTPKSPRTTKEAV